MAHTLLVGCMCLRQLEDIINGKMSQDNGLLQSGKCQDDIFWSKTHISRDILLSHDFFFFSCYAKPLMMQILPWCALLQEVAVTLCASGKLGPRRGSVALQRLSLIRFVFLSLVIHSTRLGGAERRGKTPIKHRTESISSFAAVIFCLPSL